MLRATGADETERYEALLTYCGRHGDRGAGWFKAYEAWIAGRLRELEEDGEGLEEKTAKSSPKPTLKRKLGLKNASDEPSL